MEEASGTELVKEQSRTAPRGLRLLALLSWLNTLTALILSIGLLIGGKAFAYGVSVPMFDTLLRDDSNGGWTYVIIKMFLYVASFVGVVYLWKMRKAGYWVYFAAQILLLLLPFAFLGALGWDYLLVKLMISTVFTLLFLLLFSYFYKLLN